MKSDFNYIFIWRDANTLDLGSFSDDLETMISLVDKYGSEAFHVASDRLKKHKNFVLYSAFRDPYVWNELYIFKNKLAFDKSVIIATINSDGFYAMKDSFSANDLYSMIFSDKYLSCDLDILLAIADVDPEELLMSLNDSVKSNKKAMLLLLEKCGSLLQVASEQLKDDEDVVIEAISSDIEAFKFASSRLRYNKKIVACAINSVVYNMGNFDESYINNVLDFLIYNTNDECVDFINEYRNNELKSDINKVKKNKRRF
ncbi:MAG: DUF4116 domain-containing protein [Bacilli bacterium]|nr:DUF4116 domain-containing protein [Bacilli bacterium]